MNKHLWSLSIGFHAQVVVPMASFWAQAIAKLVLKSTLCAYLFEIKTEYWDRAGGGQGTHAIARSVAKFVHAQNIV